MKKIIGNQSIDQIFAQIEQKVQEVSYDVPPPNSISIKDYARLKGCGESNARQTLRGMVDRGVFEVVTVRSGSHRAKYYRLKGEQ
jgi:hypothetical protein